MWEEGFWSAKRVYSSSVLGGGRRVVVVVWEEVKEVSKETFLWGGVWE